MKFGRRPRGARGFSGVRADSVRKEGAPTVGQPAAEPPRDSEAVDELVQLPLDPDIATGAEIWHRPDVDRPGPFPRRRRSRWPRIHWGTVAAIAAGAFFGGLARYGVGLAWPTPAGRFPWGTFAVNTAGAFVLALLLILVLEVLPPTRYLRPVIGTGFCGALTTFSAVATGVDQLAAHGHAALAVGYLTASVLAGLAAASFGIIVGRSVAANREKGRE